MSIFKRWRNKKHLDDIRAMPCVVCGRAACAHHIIAVGDGITGSTAPDSMAFPLCLKHHTGGEGIHRIGVETWENEYGSQFEHLACTLAKLKEQE